MTRPLPNRFDRDLVCDVAARAGIDPRDAAIAVEATVQVLAARLPSQIFAQVSDALTAGGEAASIIASGRGRAKRADG